MQEFLPGARDGWELALDELRRDPERFLDARARSLGEVTGEHAHRARLRRRRSRRSRPRSPAHEALALLTATIDEEIERVFLDLPDDEAAGADRAAAARTCANACSCSRTVGVGGRVIRPTATTTSARPCSRRAAAGSILDFEGEPARPLPERRRKRSPLRDVAGMLRSFAYAAARRGCCAAARRRTAGRTRARERSSRATSRRVDAALLPPGQRGDRAAAAVFELEKAVYELRYELDNRPDWVRDPGGRHRSACSRSRR